MGGFTNKIAFINAVKNTFELFPNAIIPFTPDEWLKRVLSY